MDSPCFCAKYCTYVVGMCMETLDIIVLEIVDKRGVNYCEKCFYGKMVFRFSCHCECGYKRGHYGRPFTDFKIRESHHHKKHSFDMWHAAKNLAKKITSAGIDTLNQGYQPLDQGYN